MGAALGRRGTGVSSTSRRPPNRPATPPGTPGQPPRPQLARQPATPPLLTRPPVASGQVPDVARQNAAPCPCGCALRNDALASRQDRASSSPALFTAPQHRAASPNGPCLRSRFEAAPAPRDPATRPTRSSAAPVRHGARG